MTIEQSILPRQPMTLKLKEILAATLGKPVGLGAVPQVKEGTSTTLTPVAAPYHILHPLWRNSLAGTWTHPDADVEWVYQLSSYSERTDQLEGMHDKGLQVFLARHRDGTFKTPIEVAGIRVIGRELKDDDGGDPPPVGSLLSAHFRVGLLVSPGNT